MKLFGQITIIGVGLLGGSIAKACRERKLSEKIIGYGRNQDNLKRAIDLKIIDDYHMDLKSSVENADLIILCSPVGNLAPLAKEMIPWVKKGSHITDAGSVKGSIVHEIDRIVQGTAYFVGAHPIAGGEKSGLGASDKDLFKDARCIVTPTEKTNPEALKKIINFWQEIGMTVDKMDADEHDQILGAVSHLPHVVAYALINAIGGMKTGNHPEILSFSSGGLKDATRIAASDPVMWRDICLHNREQVLKSIDRFQDKLNRLRKFIEDKEGGALEESFKRANEHRLKLVG